MKNKKQVTSTSLLAILSLILLSGCTSFNDYNPSPVGVYYPNGCLRVSAPKADFFKREDVISICRPTKIKVVGLFNNNTLMNYWYEMAILENPAGSGDDYYVGIATMQRYGNVVYTGKESKIQRFGRKISNFFTNLWGIILVIIGLSILGLFMGGADGGSWSGGGSWSSGGKSGTWSGGGSFKSD